MIFLLHVQHPSGLVQTVAFASAFLRGLFVIGLADQPVTFTLEDRS